MGDWGRMRVRGTQVPTNTAPGRERMRLTVGAGVEGTMDGWQKNWRHLWGGGRPEETTMFASPSGLFFFAFFLVTSVNRRNVLFYCMGVAHGSVLKGQEGRSFRRDQDGQRRDDGSVGGEGGGLLASRRCLRSFRRLREEGRRRIPLAGGRTPPPAAPISALLDPAHHPEMAFPSASADTASAAVSVQRIC